MGGSVRDKWGSVPDQVGVCVEGCLWAARWPLACAWWWQQVGEEDRFSASRSTLLYRLQSLVLVLVGCVQFLTCVRLVCFMRGRGVNLV